jgi:hypothetical protein
MQGKLVDRTHKKVNLSRKIVLVYTNVNISQVDQNLLLREIHQYITWYAPNVQVRVQSLSSFPP